MKKQLLTWLLVALTTIVYAQHITITPMSLDPRSNRFIMYYNTKLTVRCETLEGVTVQQMFGREEIMSVPDSIFFCLRKDYYKIWIPETHSMFTVLPTFGEHLQLGNHLLLFIQLIRDWRLNK